MKRKELNHQCETYLTKLSEDISDRSTGSEGNSKATRYFEKITTSFGWHTEESEFDALDWQNGKASLKVDNEDFEVFSSPYSFECTVKSDLVKATTIDELQQLDTDDKVLLLMGEISKEKLMPKNFVFYNPEEHQKIIALLEEKRPMAIITASSRKVVPAGGIYPFPLIEDGDFNIPSFYMTEEGGLRLSSLIGKQVLLESFAKRIPSKAKNIIARRGKDKSKRIVITAHIDAIKEMPGALDNATGVTVLLLLAELLQDYNENIMIELVAINGEDHYAVPGQMNYLSSNQGYFNEIILNINIDGVGYCEGESAFSFFDLPEMIKKKTDELIKENAGIVECAQWPQGDHSMFVVNGVPAIAITSKWFLDNMYSQTITHTLKDNKEIVDCNKVVEAAQVLEWLLRECTKSSYIENCQD